MGDVGLLGVPLVVTEKLDGSNVAFTRDAIFARSHSGAPGHPSFAAAKALHASVRFQIPPGLSIFGEWTYAVHSIEYEALPSWFHVFAARWDGIPWDSLSPTWWAWSDVETIAAEIGAPTVPVLSKGVDITTLRALESYTIAYMGHPSVYGGAREGVVVRVSGAIHDADFATKIGKLVRADHVQTNEHWSHGPVRRQRLREGV
jgi:hypothetical protein